MTASRQQVRFCKAPDGTRIALATMGKAPPLLAPFIWRDAVAAAPVLRREWRLIAGLGATGIAAFQTLVYVALQSTTATSALLTLSLTPIAILAGAALIGTAGRTPACRRAGSRLPALPF